jgi:hypothetical protein
MLIGNYISPQIQHLKTHVVDPIAGPCPCSKGNMKLFFRLGFALLMSRPAKAQEASYK